MARRKAVATGSTSRRSGWVIARSANAAEQLGPAMSPTKSQPGTPREKQSPRKAAARGPWSEERLLTSAKSRLIDLDLTKLLAKPEAWNLLDEDEKQEILALLPDNTHPNPEPSPENPDAGIPPLPEHFLRYSNNWRDGIRQFQIDLQNGRYDPEWLRRAEEAGRQREEGDFDNFKEREFEEFWGQKQKMDHSLLAGESSRVKLVTLIEAGVILPGDVWKFTHVFGRPPNRIVVEKEARISEIHGKNMTFVIPEGQRVFLSSLPTQVQDSKAPEQPKETKEDLDVGTHPAPTDADEEQKPAGQPNLQVLMVSRNEDSVSNGEGFKRTTPPPEPQPPAKWRRGLPPSNKNKPKQAPPDTNDKNEVNGVTPQPSPVRIAVEINGHRSPAVESSVPTEASADNTAENADGAENTAQAVAPPPANTEETEQTETNTPPSPPEPPTDSAPTPSPFLAAAPGELVVPNIPSPQALVNKILQIDGRMPNGRNPNSWKEIRCYRKNQDMGSLWDVRQAWFFKQK